MEEEPNKMKDKRRFAIKNDWNVNIFQNKQQIVDIHKQIGAGNIGKVYLIDYKFNQSIIQVVLKLVQISKHNEDGKKSLTREIQICNLLIKYNSLPNLIKFYQAEWLEDTHNCKRAYFIMEKADFQLKSDQIKNQPLQIRLDIASQMVKAIKQLHFLNIAHRDIKLQNFLIKKQKNIFIVKIADMGCSRDYSKQNQTNIGQKGTIKIKMNAKEIIKKKSELMNQTNVGSEIYNPPQIILPQISYRNFKSPDIWQLCLALLQIIYKKNFVNNSYSNFINSHVFQNKNNLSKQQLENIKGIGAFVAQKAFINEPKLLNTIFLGLIFNPDERLQNLDSIEDLLKPYECYQTYRFQNRKYFNILKHLLNFEYIVNIYNNQIEENQNYIIFKGKHKKDQISVQQECTIKVYYNNDNKNQSNSVEQQFKIYDIVHRNNNQKFIKIFKISNEIIKDQKKNNIRFIIFQRIQCNLQNFNHKKLKIENKLSIMCALCETVQLFHSIRLALYQLQFRDVGIIETKNVYTQKIINFSKAKYYYNKEIKYTIQNINSIQLDKSMPPEFLNKANIKQNNKIQIAEYTSPDIWLMGKFFLQLIYNYKNLPLNINNINIVQLGYLNQANFLSIIKNHLQQSPDQREKSIQKLKHALLPYSSNKLEIIQQSLLGKIFQIFPELKKQIEFVRKNSETEFYETYSIRYQTYEENVPAIIKIYPKISQKPDYIIKYIQRQQNFNKNYISKSKGILKVYDSNIRQNYAYIVQQFYISNCLNFLNRKTEYKIENSIIIASFKQLISNIRFLQENKISHMNIVPENFYLVGTNNEVQSIKLGNFGWYIQTDFEKQPLHLNNYYKNKFKKFKPPEYFFPDYKVSRFDSDIWMFTTTIISFLTNQQLLKSDEAIQNYYRQLLKDMESSYYQIDFKKAVVKNVTETLNYGQQTSKKLSETILLIDPIKRKKGLNLLLDFANYLTVMRLNTVQNKKNQKSLKAFESNYLLCLYIQEFVNGFIYITTNQKFKFERTLFNRIIDDISLYNKKNTTNNNDQFLQRIKKFQGQYYVRVSSWNFLFSFLERKCIREAELKLNYDQLSEDQKIQYLPKKQHLNRLKQLAQSRTRQNLLFMSKQDPTISKIFDEDSDERVKICFKHYLCPLLLLLRLHSIVSRKIFNENSRSILKMVLLCKEVDKYINSEDQIQTSLSLENFNNLSIKQIMTLPQVLEIKKYLI